MKKPGRNDPCWCGSGKKYKKCHLGKDNDIDFSKPSTTPDKKNNTNIIQTVPDNIPKPEYAISGKGESRDRMPVFLSTEELVEMRKTCRAARRVLEKGLSAVRPGISTNEIDKIVHEACIAEGGYPSPLNYHGFPKSVCISVNEVICHGIPDGRILQDGDIVNVDVTLFLNGFHGDCSETVAVGQIDPESQKLLRVTKECLHIGIEAAKPGNRIRDIGKAIESHANNNNYSVVRAYCGHGIGRKFHTYPTIPHFYDRTERDKIKPGMIFTIEPMINQGHWKHKILSDGWTAVTADNTRSAQFEHTVLITDDGAEILTC